MQPYAKLPFYAVFSHRNHPSAVVASIATHPKIWLLKTPKVLLRPAFPVAVNSGWEQPQPTRFSPASFSTLGVAPALVGISGVFVPPTASMGVSSPLEK